jgi:membrane fusion protein, multidrug efflux system
VGIEPERYNLAVRSAEAALEKAKAGRRETQSGLARRVDIAAKNPGYISPEEIEDWRTRAYSADADSTKAAADLELARLNLRDAHVPAPASGAIQTRSIQTGQYVQAGTVIATLVRRDPLLLRFTVPELDAMRIRKGMTAMFHVRGGGEDYTARITAVSEAADPSTRLVRITAEVTDPDRGALRPGSFAEVTVQLGERTKLPVIPQTAIRPSEKGFVSFVVEDSTAHERILTLGSRSPEGLVEVRSGLQSGDKIVVRGAEALRDGAPVRIMQSDSAADSTERAGR